MKVMNSEFRIRLRYVSFLSAYILFCCLYSSKGISGNCEGLLVELSDSRIHGTEITRSPQLNKTKFVDGNTFTTSIPIKSIEEEAELSGINIDTLTAMKMHSRSVTDINGLLKMNLKSEGTVLGLDGEIANGIASIKGFKNFWRAHLEFGIPLSLGSNTHLFMKSLVENQETVIFLIPRNFTGKKAHNNQGKTLAEFEWMQENPKKRMKNVVFVFGVYDLLSDETIERINKMAHEKAVAIHGEPGGTPWNWEGRNAKIDLIKNEITSFFTNSNFIYEP